jgi:hypothetical protein
MSNFILMNKKTLNIDGLDSFDFEFDFLNYRILISGQYIKNNNSHGGCDFFFGSALYYGKRVNELTFSSLITDEINFSELSGRFLIISIRDDNVRIVNSIFGSFPCYISSDGDVIGTNQTLIAKIKSTSISFDGLRERALYFTNYETTLFEGIDLIKPGSECVLQNSKLTANSYLSKVIKKLDDCDLDESVGMLAELIGNNTKSYFEDSDKAYVSYTGGRDSRLLLCQLIKSMPKEKIEAFTIGFDSDIEYFIGKEFTKYNGISHSLVRPSLLTEEGIANYAETFENINFTCQYKTQVIDYLKKYKCDVLNTAIPETILCHMDYFLGDSHYAINFVRKRKSIFKADQIINGNQIESGVETAAVRIWDELRRELPTDVSANIFFELTTFQRDWVFKILRPFDIAGNTVCVMEDPKILSILSSIEMDDFFNDRLYKRLVDKSYPELNVTPTTRDINLSIVKKYKFIDLIKYSPLILRSIIFAGSLSKLLKMNYPFIAKYCEKNKEKLALIFNEDFVNELLLKQKKNIYSDNRIVKLFVRLLYNKKTLDDYELIAPLCIIALIKNNHD